LHFIAPWRFEGGSCAAAYQKTLQARRNLRLQYDIVGAPYSSDELKVQYLTNLDADPIKGRIYYPKSQYNFIVAAGGISCTLETFNKINKAIMHVVSLLCQMRKQMILLERQSMGWILGRPLLRMTFENIIYGRNTKKYYWL
jgi:hypothetical protein